MPIVHYRTKISRTKLVKFHHEPDLTDWQEIGHVKESSEPYYTPAVEMLDAVQRHIRQAN